MDTRYQGNPAPVTAHALARSKVSDGKSVTVTVPQNTTVTAGEWVLLDGFFGLAMQNVVTGAGETKELVLTIEQAEFETDQISTSQTFAKGAALYWNATTKKITETATDNRLVGRVTNGKDANNVIWFLLGPQA
ncbi:MULTISPECIES: DUF2190 family protein [Paenibacillus]|uniref:DUF2190 family protein n=1 Tax=Paenibacillus macerans TaxID=44252 RepID=A0A090ZA19_PAEMA|nr:DUF2190 family protein [Paenibacillus macerans]KFN07258.1 hypothetical protein DJ90_5667 [Paenibacillus macerans]MCY7558222.1 DUF2190 family protein [Paenibacillus macerans]MEC0154640.1 DUF2190 family protein [Paenibacillus macerans]SUA85628.1 Uncharacterized conserved protein [Paenibacillus macerans]